MVQTTRNWILCVWRQNHFKFWISRWNKYQWCLLRFTFNLLSIGSIIDMGLVLMFDDKECFIYQTLNKIVGQGIHTSKTSLYWYIIIDPKFKIYAIASHLVVHLWHHHIGFLNQHNVRSMGLHHIAEGVPLISRPHDLCNNY
jgi:hypothetical protein